MIEIELTNISVKSVIVYPDDDGFLCGPGQALVLPPQDVKVVQCRAVTRLQAVSMDGIHYQYGLPQVHIGHPWYVLNSEYVLRGSQHQYKLQQCQVVLRPDEVQLWLN